MHSYYGILLLGIMAFSVFACKSEEERARTAAEKIQGKWQLVSYKHIEHFVNMQDSQHQVGADTDIYNFGSDGKLYIGSDKKHALTYSIPNDSIFWFGGEPYHITYLTDSTFAIHQRETNLYSPVLYNETTYSFKK